MRDATERTAHIRAVEVLAQVHQSKKCAQNSRLQIIRQVQAAGCHARQRFAIRGDKHHDLPLPFVRRVAQRRFSTHLRATRFQRQRKMQQAQTVLGDRGWSVVFATGDLAGGGHGLHEIVNIPARENPATFRGMVRKPHGGELLLPF